MIGSTPPDRAAAFPRVGTFRSANVTSGVAAERPRPSHSRVHFVPTRGEPRDRIGVGSGVGSGDVLMSARSYGGRLNGMENNDIPTGTIPHGTIPAGTTDASQAALPPAPAPRFTLRRSRTDRMLAGVCGGLAASLGADAAMLRVLLVALTLITGGAAAIVYVAAWALAPEDDRPAY
jgi:phage shock protein PspC (stress-responsive transcriptional regulator)